MLAVGTYDGRIRLVDAPTGMVRWDVQSYQVTGDIAVAMPPDGRFVASVGDSEENWKLWHCGSGVLCMTGARHRSTEREPASAG